MRPYSDADLPRLSRTFAAWIAEAGRCGYDHVGEVPHRIYENLRGRPPGELVQLWESADEIVGLAVNLRFGAAFDVFTAPALRGTAAEVEMLRTAYRTTTRAMTADQPYVLTDVFDCDSIRIRLLTELGFARFRTWDDVTVRQLTGPVDAPVAPEGFVLRTARPADAGQLALARNSAFDADWTAELYRSAVMTRPGYSAEREIVAEAPDGRIAAFTVYWLDGRNRVGHFEPVGTHRDFNRRGLARAVMLTAMHRMRAAGMATVTVNYNADNLPAQRLYASLGFRREHQTYGFRRPRPDPPTT
ncbi:GNAT family N-acetyltransferase [Plantactinospora sp. KLBMP9567]|uniref:GNAT family N-acetyltransferase n=1 Tax=Plantactinospora sp. KLBMP9567 TaxID=3085900 RepID=UPI0029811B3B|nr:GNAT family N-acetyltransferase [Plantactinospora sp. KLBMP9567]MDW5327673.1 GNAT family N-acetyltransferase [Plantactinospora sp. KLBMP9567]MDW5329199.1 GNAT family N-acetyltransferase [Plantactinospora sp. KLBMP9567]